MPTAGRDYNELGRKLLDEGNLETAIEAFESAIAASPTVAIPWFNLGLLYKRQRQWQKALECNQQAVLLDNKSGDAWWNLGIAATALAYWDTARMAWKSYGLELPAGDGEVRVNLGTTPIRINPELRREVVWCDRIDPARAIISNIPLPHSDHRYQDILLHDGAPNGYRMYKGQEVPVFDELQVLRRSNMSTYEVCVHAPADDIEALTDVAYEAGIIGENWSSIRRVCRKCSEGLLHENHVIEQVQDPQPRIGIAAREEGTVHQVVAQWQAAHPTVEVLSITCVLHA